MGREIVCVRVIAPPAAYPTLPQLHAHNTLHARFPPPPPGYCRMIRRHAGSFELPRCSPPGKGRKTSPGTSKMRLMNALSLECVLSPFHFGSTVYTDLPAL